MKKIAAFTLALLPLTGVTQDISIDTAASFSITKQGKPDGNKTEMKIGKEGGSLSSSDGIITLIIPEGALSKKTTISIQPVINYAPNGNGKAYQLEPSGIQFKQPVQIIFHYTTKESRGEMQMLMGIAMQDDKGQWYGLNKFALDTVAKTISGNITHFSSWSTFESFKIIPSSKRLKVNKSLALEVHHTGPSQGDEADELTSLGDGTLTPLVKTKYMSIEKWTVNSITNGNSNVGTVRSTGDLDASYKAPARVPDQNPVAIVAQLKDLDFSFNGEKFENLKLVSNISIYDNAYEVKMVASMKGGSREAWGGVVTYDDNGSFLVSMDKAKPEILEIENNLETMTDNCQKTILNPTTCTGIIHVTGVRTVRVTPGQPHANIEITFIQRQAEFTQHIFTCPPPPGTTGSVTQHNLAIAMLRTPAFPVSIKFQAREGEQIVYLKGEQGDPLYVRFTVTQVKDD